MYNSYFLEVAAWEHKMGVDDINHSFAIGRPYGADDL